MAEVSLINLLQPGGTVALFFVLAYLVSGLKSSFADLSKEFKTLAQELTNHRLTTAEKLITRDEYNSKVRDLEREIARLSRIVARLEGGD